MTSQDLIESFFPQLPFQSSLPMQEGHMRVDVSESEKEFVVKADVPGIDKKGLDVQFDDNILTISAHVSEERDEKSEEGKQPQVIHRERFSGKYERRFKFNKQVVGDDISAKLEDGVLTVRIAKRDPEVARRERSIAID